MPPQSSTAQPPEYADRFKSREKDNTFRSDEKMEARGRGSGAGGGTGELRERGRWRVGWRLSGSAEQASKGTRSE
jgi:hypothetical protein